MKIDKLKILAYGFTVTACIFAITMIVSFYVSAITMNPNNNISEKAFAIGGVSVISTIVFAGVSLLVFEEIELRDKRRKRNSSAGYGEF